MRAHKAVRQSGLKRRLKQWNTDVVHKHLHVDYVGWFLVTFLVVSSLGKLVVIALSVPDSPRVAFFAVAFLGQLVVCVLGTVQRFLAVSSDDHSRVYLVI